MNSKALEQVREITALRESLRSAHRRIDDLVKVADSMHELSKASAAMAIEVRLLAQNVTGIAEKLDTVRQEPADKWRTLVTSLLGAAAALAAGVMLGISIY